MNKPWDADIELMREQARTLINEQFGIEIHDISEMEAGWDNQPYLINHKFVFRFPRRKVAVALLERESAVLPYVAPQLPVPIPNPIYIGKPSRAYPYPFHGYNWISGTSASKAAVVDEKLPLLASELGAFLQHLHRLKLPIELQKALPIGGENGIRGSFKDSFQRLWERFENIIALNLISHAEIAQLLAQVNTVATCAPEQECLIHGDLFFPHLLLDDGHLSGVIDWGDMHIGDPAMDLAIVFQYFPAVVRPHFLISYGPCPEGMLLRARLWAAYSSVTLLWYGHHNNKRDLIERGLLGCKHVLEI